MFEIYCFTYVRVDEDDLNYSFYARSQEIANDMVRRIAEAGIILRPKRFRFKRIEKIDMPPEMFENMQYESIRREITKFIEERQKEEILEENIEVC